MNSFPQSIEAALEEAGFSITEILILKRLLSDDAMSIRQLAAKTGKSTGILDQAMKKLLQKGIVEKQWINDTSLYVLHSLDAVADWIAKDLKKKHESMLRKHENFEAFITTLKVDKNRPDMHFYEGLPGLIQAYRELLKPGKEIVSFIPVFCGAEDDPLRDFRVEYFRERRRLGVFQRVIAHNTSLGRRFQSRDPFEYRQTMLVEEEQFPFTFEKLIVGDQVACINHAEKRACIMRYPEMASQERGVFEGIWKEMKKPKAGIQEPGQALPVALPQKEEIPLSTRTLSSLREFFLSKRSIAAFTVFAIIAAGLTYGLYIHSKAINTKRLQERVLAIAATAVDEIDSRDVDAVRTPDDVQSPEFIKLHGILSKIIQRNPGVADAYIMRVKQAPGLSEFVVDADPVDPAPPGYIFFSSDSNPPAGLELIRPLYFEPFTDEWGTWISANAPIFPKDGSEPTSFLGVDVTASDAHKLTVNTFSFGLCFVGLFMLFVLIRLAAFNKSLLSELSQAFNFHKILKTLPISIILSLLLSGAVYLFMNQLQIQRMRDKLESIAITGALQIQSSDLDALRSEKDWLRPEWNKVVTQLEDIRNSDDGITFVYVFRRRANGDIEFVTDSHSRNPYANTDDDPRNDVDANGDGKIEPEGPDKLQWPGQDYPEPSPVVFEAFTGPVSTESSLEDSFGEVYSGFAPIRDFMGQPTAVLAVDMKPEKLQEMVAKNMNPIVYFFSFLLVFCLAQLVLCNQKFFKYCWTSLSLRRSIVVIVFCAEVSYFITFGLYFYSLHQTKREIGERLMAIAATAAPEIDPADLDQLHIAADMKKDAYQRVFKKLNEIRENNKNIQWAYVMRATENPEYWEFVVDADSNYSLPHYNDLDLSGEIDFSDGNVAPGVQYFNYLDLNAAAKEPYYTDDFQDQWGTFISGVAPIFYEGRPIGILGLDVDISDVVNEANSDFTFMIIFLITFLIVLGVWVFFSKEKNF